MTLKGECKMKIINLEIPQIIATLRPCKAHAFLYFDTDTNQCKVKNTSKALDYRLEVNYWRFKTTHHAPMQINQIIELANNKMTKDAMKAIITHFAKELNLKEVSMTAEDKIEILALFDNRLYFTFKIESNEINQKEA